MHTAPPRPRSAWIATTNYNYKELHQAQGIPQCHQMTIHIRNPTLDLQMFPPTQKVHLPGSQANHETRASTGGRCRSDALAWSDIEVQGFASAGGGVVLESIRSFLTSWDILACNMLQPEGLGMPWNEVNVHIAGQKALHRTGRDKASIQPELWVWYFNGFSWGLSIIPWTKTLVILESWSLATAYLTPQVSKALMAVICAVGASSPIKFKSSKAAKRNSQQ